MYRYRFILLVLVSVSCNSVKTTSSKEQDSKTVPPNILWIVCEDISPMLSFYGDDTARTPVLDALAKESVVYDNAFAVVGVCGPSRSAIITGMYPTSIGTMHMRTGKDIHSWGKRTYAQQKDTYDLDENPVIEYAAVIPEYVKGFPEYLRKAGYFTTNNQKTDYQFAAPVTIWDENNNKAHWRNRPEGQPFFSVFNFGVTHESRIWKNADLPLTVNPDEVPLPPYFQDTETSRTDVARVYSNIELLDKQVGDLLQQLKDDGLYNNTIIFFYSDHGGPLPRQKREIYDSGLKVPFMVKNLNGVSGRSDQLVSFVDLAPTVLSLANVNVPQHIQGKMFMGGDKANKRDFVFGSSDRFDEFTDRSRSVRDGRYLYIMHDFPEKPWYKDVGYRKQIPMMDEMLRFRESELLNSTQQEWFTDKAPAELYDCKKDPHNLINLAGDKNYADVELKLKKALLAHRAKYTDYGMMPEAQLIEQMWHNFEQPITAPITIVYEPETGNKVYLESATSGASIGYILSDEPIQKLDFNSGWQVFTDAITIQKGQYLYAMAQRIGYKESELFSTVIQ